MTKTDRNLIAGFLEQEFGAFAVYLDENDIEPTEAELIIEKLKDGDLND